MGEEGREEKVAKQEGEEGEVEGGKKREGEVGAGEGGRGESSTMAGAASVIALDRGPYGVDLLLDPDDPDDLLKLVCSYACP